MHVVPNDRRKQEDVLYFGQQLRHSVLTGPRDYSFPCRRDSVWRVPIVEPILKGVGDEGEAEVLIDTAAHLVTELVGSLGYNCPGKTVAFVQRQR
jgi:hypothetical protein